MAKAFITSLIINSILSDIIIITLWARAQIFVLYFFKSFDFWSSIHVIHHFNELLLIKFIPIYVEDVFGRLLFNSSPTILTNLKVLVSFNLLHAYPAKKAFTLQANHLVATTVFLDCRLAMGALLRTFFQIILIHRFFKSSLVSIIFLYFCRNIKTIFEIGIPSLLVQNIFFIQLEIWASNSWMVFILTIYTEIIIALGALSHLFVLIEVCWGLAFWTIAKVIHFVNSTFNWEFSVFVYDLFR